MLSGQPKRVIPGRTGPTAFGWSCFLQSRSKPRVRKVQSMRFRMVSIMATLAAIATLLGSLAWFPSAPLPSFDIGVHDFWLQIGPFRFTSDGFGFLVVLALTLTAVTAIAVGCFAGIIYVTRALWRWSRRRRTVLLPTSASRA
jgi:hypothetical protein